MLNIAKQQLLAGLLDAKFIFLSLLILLAFLSNGLIFSESYRRQMEDYRASEVENGRLIQEVCDNLQTLAILEQRLMQPPSALAFIAQGGSGLLPNVVRLNAFSRYGMELQHRTDERIPALPYLDWNFIVGSLMSLLAVLVSYSAVAGEKRDGTLRLVLSNPLSRLKLFAGKYLGLLMVLLICFFVGILLNLAAIVLMSGPPLSAASLWPIGWSLAASVLCISAFLLAGLAASSLTRHPAVALVVLLVFWVLCVFAIPGIGRLVAEQVVGVPTQESVRDEISSTLNAIDEAAPRGAHYWNADPFADNMPDRAKLWTDWNNASMRIRDDYLEAQIRQASMAKVFAFASPQAVLTDALQRLGGTGIHGFRQLHLNARQYRSDLYRFAANRDAVDSSTPHLVYGGRGHFDTGTFSQRPVPYSAVPRASSLWNESGLPIGGGQPLWHLLILLGFNLIAGMIALAALLRYDPR